MSHWQPLQEGELEAHAIPCGSRWKPFLARRRLAFPNTGGRMLTHFPQAVPEIPVSNVDRAAEYYVNVLGFSFDWGNDDGGIGGISQGDCRMFLTNAPFRAVHGPKSPVIIWLNLNSKQEVDELFERWKDTGAKIGE